MGASKVAIPTQDLNPQNAQEGTRVSTDNGTILGTIEQVIWWADNSITAYIQWNGRDKLEPLPIRYPSGDACF